MAIIFEDSFDGYDTSSYGYFAAKWNGLIPGVFSYGVTSGGRSGGNRLLISSGTATHIPATAGDSFIQAFAFLSGTLAAIRLCGFWNDDGGGINDGNVVCFVGFDSLGRATVWDRYGPLAKSTAQTLYQANQWHHCQVKVTVTGFSDPSNTVTFDVVVLVDSAEVLNETSLVSTGNVSTIGQITQLGPTVATYGIYYDDFYIVDCNGSPADDFRGDLYGVAILPNGAGSNTNGTPSAGSNYQCVDENPPNGDTDYVEGAASDKDTYAFADISLPSGSTIVAVQTCVLARKTGGSPTIAPVTRSGTDYPGTAVPLGDSYKFVLNLEEADPDTAAAWDETGVNAAEFGWES